MSGHAGQTLKKLCLIFSLMVLWEASAWAQEEKNWFAVVGSFRQREQAEQFAQKLANQGYRPEIYLAENNYYAVTLGAYLDREQAKQLVDQARKEGIAADAYAWRSNFWGQNLYRPETSPPAASVWLSLEEIQKQVVPRLDDLRILRPWISKTSSLSIFQPTISLSPPDQSLSMQFPFSYAVAGDPRYQMLYRQEGKGVVEIRVKIGLQNAQLVLGRVISQNLVPPTLPVEIEEALRRDWLEALRVRLENTVLAASQFPVTKLTISFNGITLSQ